MSRLTEMQLLDVYKRQGYPRALSNKGSILIHGKKAPILGRICMDQTMVDISDIPEAKEGDEVVVIGKKYFPYLKVDVYKRQVLRQMYRSHLAMEK